MTAVFIRRVHLVAEDAAGVDISVRVQTTDGGERTYREVKGDGAWRIFRTEDGRPATYILETEGAVWGREVQGEGPWELVK